MKQRVAAANVSSNLIVASSSEQDIQAPSGIEEGNSLNSVIPGEPNSSIGDTQSGARNIIESYKDKDGQYQKIFKLIFCFVGLQVSYILWGIAQEQIMTTEYKGGKFKSSAFCVFGNRVLALFISIIIVAYKRMKLASSKMTMKEAPSYTYIPSSLSNCLSSWAQYEALKYLSFPTQVLSKSCKIIPVMIVGIMLNKKSYPLLEYFEAGLITTGVAIFTMMDKAKAAHVHTEDSLWGVFLIIMYLGCDSFTSQWQSKIYKQYSIDQFQMMLGVNVWSMLLTGISLVTSGDGISSMAFILEDSNALWHTVVLSVTSAVGQLFIFYTIKELGPVTFTIMMTTRQIFSLVLSCLLFAHPLTWLSWVGAAIVFATVFNRIRRKGSD